MCRGLVRADECLVMRYSLLAASALLHETPGIDLQIYMRIIVQKAEMTQKIPLNRPNFCSAPAEKVTELEELLNKKDQEMKVMEDRYKKYLEKAKSVSRRIRSELLLYMKCHKFAELTTYLTTEFEINFSFHSLQ